MVVPIIGARAHKAKRRWLDGLLLEGKLVILGLRGKLLVIHPKSHIGEIMSYLVYRSSLTILVLV